MAKASRGTRKELQGVADLLMTKGIRFTRTCNIQILCNNGGHTADKSDSPRHTGVFGGSTPPQYWVFTIARMRSRESQASFGACRGSRREKGYRSKTFANPEEQITGKLSVFVTIVAGAVYLSWW